MGKVSERPSVTLPDRTPSSPGPLSAARKQGIALGSADSAEIHYMLLLLHTNILWFDSLQSKRNTYDLQQKSSNTLVGLYLLSYLKR